MRLHHSAPKGTKQKVTTANASGYLPRLSPLLKPPNGFAAKGEPVTFTLSKKTIALR